MISFVFAHQKKYMFNTIVYYTISVFAWIISIIIPKIFGYFIDALTLPSSPMLELVALFLFANLLQSILGLLRVKIYNIVYLKISHSIYTNVYSHILTLDRKEYAAINPYYFNESVTTDSFEMTSYIMNNLFNLMMTSLTFLVGIVVLFENFSLKAFIVVLLLPFYYFLHYYSYKTYHNLNSDYTESVNLYHALKSHEAENIDLINFKSWREKSTERIDESFNKTINIYDRVLSFRFKIDGLAGIIRVLIIGVTLLMSVISVEREVMSVGELTLVNTYTLMILSCVSDYLAFGKSYSRAKIAYNRLKGYLLISAANEGNNQINSIPFIKICNLSFLYGDKRLLHGLNYTFAKGNIYGITGPNGNGKTTFLRIITGMEKEYQGEILIGEYSLRMIDTCALRKSLISVVTQVPTLYFDNMNDELYFDKNEPNFDYSVLFECNRLVDDTFRGDKGYSIGQKQKINIVHSLNKKADMIIMDEPTSSLDNKSVERLANILLRIKNEKIIVLVSHDSRLLKICDKIFEL